MTFWIVGLGTAVPNHTMSQQEATELARRVVCQTDQQARLLTALYRRSGVSQRHTVLPHRRALDWLPEEQADAAQAESAATGGTLGPSTRERMQFFAEHAPPLAVQAARRALEDARLNGNAVTHLVTVTCTGFDAPGIDTALITHLGLAPTTQRIHVGFMGCHGAINGLRAARAISVAEPTARPLICAVELCSLHFRFRWDDERIVANALFADGAAAIVGAGQPPRADDMRANWSVHATGSCLIPDSLDAMTWRIGDHGFEMTLSARVPELIGEHLRPWLESWLDEQGLSIASVGSWAVHPGGPRIVSAVEETLGLSRDATAISREVLAEYGNMSSPTVLFIVDRLRQFGAPRPCVALGFGPGMFAEAALLL